MNKRERTLAILTGALVTILAVSFLFSAFGTPLKQQRALRDDLAKKVDDKKAQLEKGEKAQSRLDEWNRCSLPSDYQIARTLYQNWLLALINRLGFDGETVDVSTGRSRLDVYDNLIFTVRGDATFAQLTDFLYEFYSSGHLHQIRNLSIKPQADGRSLHVDISIEALSLRGADRADKLSEESSERLAFSDRSEYQKTIVDRSLFSPYEPPRPEPPVASGLPRPVGFDHSRYTFVDGIVEVDGQAEVWIRVRTQGNEFKLREGDRFEIGSIRGVVVGIGSRLVELDINGQRCLVALGENLHDAGFSGQ